MKLETKLVLEGIHRKNSLDFADSQNLIYKGALERIFYMNLLINHMQEYSSIPIQARNCPVYAFSEATKSARWSHGHPDDPILLIADTSKISRKLISKNLDPYHKWNTFDLGSFLIADNLYPAIKDLIEEDGAIKYQASKIIADMVKPLEEKLLTSKKQKIKEITLDKICDRLKTYVINSV